MYYQLKISLKKLKPEVWRRIIISKECNFSEFHKIIQILFNWKNYHQHIFKGKKNLVTNANTDIFNQPTDVNENDFNKINPDNYDLNYEKFTKLHEIINSSRKRIEYSYDTIDNWIHLIVLEKELDETEYINLPICTGGKNASPPEDIGGVGGFMTMQRIIKDERHPLHKEFLENFEEFDPEFFNKALVNFKLRDYFD